MMMLDLGFILSVALAQAATNLDNLKLLFLLTHSLRRVKSAYLVLSGTGNRFGHGTGWEVALKFWPEVTPGSLGTCRHFLVC